MKKIFSKTLLAVLVMGWGSASAQCPISTTNTTPGFTPNPADTITQGVLYAQTTQVYVPTTVTVSGITATIDSIHIDSIGNVPAGITEVYNPSSRTVPGGGRGAICFSGVTHAYDSTYNLIFYGTAYASAFGQNENLPLNQPPVSTQFTYSLTVKAASAPAGGSCDTTYNVVPSDTPSVYVWSPGEGYISGNGGFSYQGTTFQNAQIGEQFFGAIGDSVTSAYFSFAKVTINSSDSANLVKFYIYSNSGTGAASLPNVPIDSTFLTLKHIARDLTNHNPSEAIFTGAVLTASTFYVSVVLPTTAGDTLVVVTNNGNTPYGKGFLDVPSASALFGTNGWIPYTGLIGGLNQLGNYIGVTICGSNTVAVSNFTESATFGCGGSLSVTFNDQSTGTPTGYAWDFGDGGTSTSASPTHTFTAGSYLVTETVTSSGGSTYSTTYVTVDTAINASVSVTPSASSATNNGSATLTVTGGSAPYTYLWSNGQTTATADSLSAAVYSVIIMDSYGCADTLDSIIIVNTGIIELGNGQHVSVYPNPASSELNLVWSKEMNAEISVVDLSGNVLNTTTTSGQTKTVFDITNLAAGSYILRITEKGTNAQQSMQFTKF